MITLTQFIFSVEKDKTLKEDCIMIKERYKIHIGDKEGIWVNMGNNLII